MVGPQLEALVLQNPRARLRRIDIGSWHSEVAAQCRIDRLPSVWLYDAGRLVSRDLQQVATQLQQTR